MQVSSSFSIMVYFLEVLPFRYSICDGREGTEEGNPPVLLGEFEGLPALVEDPVPQVIPVIVLARTFPRAAEFNATEAVPDVAPVGVEANQGVESVDDSAPEGEQPDDLTDEDFPATDEPSS